MADLVSKYLEQIHQKTGGSQCVYRGQADARWLLQSSAERRIKRSFNDYIRGTRDEILRAYQTNLLSEARQKGFGHQEGRILTDLELLAQLQHFNAATLLLDFSEQAMVALYFACNDQKYYVSDGKIFIIKEGFIKHAQTNEKIEEIIDNSKMRQWRPTLHGPAERRIMAQSGLFMINLVEEEKYVTSINIEKKDKAILIEELNNRFQISANTLFMDLAGFAESQSTYQKVEHALMYFYKSQISSVTEDSEKSIKCLNEAIRLKPNFFEAYYNRGLRKMQIGDYQGAFQDFDNAIFIQPNDDVAYYNRGLCLETMGYVNRAIGDYDKAISLNPKNDAAYYKRGLSKEMIANLKGAIQDYDEAIKLNPNLAEAFFNRGVCKSDLGDHKEALSDYNEAIRLKPNFAEAFNNRGIEKKDLGDLYGAILDYNEAISLKPDFAEAFNNRGLYKKKIGDYREALLDFDKAIKLKPDYSYAFNNRGLCRKKMKNFRVAIKDFNKAIKLNPEYVSAIYNRGLCNISLVNFKEARNDLAQALDLAHQRDDHDLAKIIQKELDKLN